jgi:Zn-dependent protease
VGLEGQPTSNQLLGIRHQIEPEGDGARLRTTYHWGKRLLLGQLLARTDLWGGIYRIKSLAETGKASNRAYAVISGLVALGTAVASIVAFALLVPWWFALVVVLILLIHEFGHLLAFRLIGQPWGRLVFLPFLGAMAVPRLPYQSQAESVFSALMGPGFSCLLAIGCLVPAVMHWPGQGVWYVVGAVTAGLNAFNMLPAEPLDGGVALRSVASRVMGSSAWAALIGVGLIIVTVGYVRGNIAFMIFGGLAVLANFRRRRIDTGLAPLTSLQVCIAFFAYMSITAAHFTLLDHFMMQLGIGHGA